jgi:hypothetical protein
VIAQARRSLPRLYLRARHDAWLIRRVPWFALAEVRRQRETTTALIALVEVLVGDEPLSANRARIRAAVDEIRRSADNARDEALKGR